MPNRIVRAGINSSDRVNQLDYAEEVFYRRLINAVDDYGLFDARPAILRAHLYPLRLDRVREADLQRWMAACQKAGLIVLYEAENKPYLQILDTRWKSRSEPKFPLPPAGVGNQPPDDSNLPQPADACEQLHADENNYAQLSPYSESETDSESKSVNNGSHLSLAKKLTLTQAVASVMGMADLPEGKPGELYRLAVEEFRLAGVTPEEVPAFGREWYARKMRSGQNKIVLTLPILRQDLPAWSSAKRMRALPDDSQASSAYSCARCQDRGIIASPNGGRPIECPNCSPQEAKNARRTA